VRANQSLERQVLINTTHSASECISNSSPGKGARSSFCTPIATSSTETRSSDPRAAR
jgi:hypothetical protein